jgi:hypothetical protein
MRSSGMQWRWTGWQWGLMRWLFGAALLGVLASCQTSALLHRPMVPVTPDMAYVLWVLSWEAESEAPTPAPALPPHPTP